MGIFTSACKNCGRKINWYNMMDNHTRYCCVHCHTDNNKEELSKNFLEPNDVNLIRREYKDKLLYNKEIDDYINQDNK